ncbi:MAG: hypothetical protein K6G28_04205 [Acholeplasmatales bacterium]|nr:hypothetical protein [Acholeplasmatales bacterium]
MLDINKFHSKSLAANVSTAVLLPDNYNNVDTVYKPIYVLTTNNPFLNDQKYQEFVNSANIALIAIYPSLDIKKNELLFDSFDTEYDFSKQYQEFIIESLIPNITRLYRLSNKFSDKYLVGIDKTSLLAYTFPLDFTTTFGHLYSINLNVDDFKADFLAYTKSKFDPQVEMNLSLTNKDIQKEIKDILKMFGIISYNDFDTNNLFDTIINII